MRLSSAAAAVAAVLLASAPALAAEPAPSKAEAAALLDQARGLIEKDPAKARALVERAAQSNDPEALNHLGAFVGQGIGGPADPDKATAILERAAARGSNGARLSLGHMLIRQDSDADRRRGFKFLEQAYADPKAKGFAAKGLGIAYAFGYGVPRDTDRAVALLTEASTQDDSDPEVEFLLGRAYQNGYGKLEPDPPRAYRHLRRAAELGNPHAAWLTGMMLLNGDGVAKDDREAYRWVRRAGEEGDLGGMISTAVMLATGEGVQENDVEARGWYEKAVERNSAHALRGLGIMLYNGEGGPADQVRGYAYLKLAEQGGDGNATKILATIQVPAATAAAADKLAADWLAKKGKPKPDS
jgi:TPR repeat protein